MCSKIFSTRGDGRRATQRQREEAMAIRGERNASVTLWDKEKA